MKQWFALAAAFCTMAVASLAAADTLTLTTNKTTYVPGEVISFTAVYKTNSGTAITRPSKKELRIRDAVNGNTLATVSMSGGTNGIYTYNYTLSSSAKIGSYEGRATFTYNNVTTVAYTYPVVGTVTPTNPHASLTYTGNTMCVTCHSAQASAMAGAVHYKWEGPYAAITNKPGEVGGKVNKAMNTFCINVMGNWNGCGSCHVGLGAKPGTVADATKNIDCLICHQKDYKRFRNAITNLFEPDTTKMSITMDQAVQTVHKPVKSNCLQCHANGGGGDGLKRGDLSLINGTTSDRNFDVHMASTGAKLSCQNCHTYTNHRVKGRGVDLRPTDSAGEVGCATTVCHPTRSSRIAGHTNASINNHMKRVACQTCHIPVAGKKAADAVVNTVTGFGDQATEYDRTWVTPEWSIANNRWEPTIHKANNIKPAYLFWDGTSWVSDLNDIPVLDPATGKYKISRPNGGINTANTKLYPFKYKTSLQPRHLATGKLIALNTSVYFKNADVMGAIQSGLTNMGLNAGDAYDFVTTDEYLLLNHTVSPKAAALQCAACHGTNRTTPGTQMNLKAMGYGLKAADSVVCRQCHGQEGSPGFNSVHSKHVNSERIDCSMCHNFTRANERGLSVGIKR